MVTPNCDEMMETHLFIDHNTSDDLYVDGNHVAMARYSAMKQEPLPSDCEDEPFVDMGGFLELETVVKNESAFDTDPKIIHDVVTPRKQIIELNHAGSADSAKHLTPQDKADTETEVDGKGFNKFVPILNMQDKCASSTSNVPKNASDVQTPSDKYTCCLCEVYFHSDVDLRDHNISTHSMENQSSCSICEESFRDILGFKEHLRKHFSSRCSVCMKVLSAEQVQDLKCKNCTTIPSEPSKMSTNRSIVICKDVKTFQCAACKVTFTSSSDLKSHVKLHRQKIAQCPICGKIFTEKHTLNQHLKLHSGSRPFKCETCGLTFTRASHLKQHRITHVGIRAYECATCSKRFSLKSSLIRHMTTHRLSSDDRRFMCEVCGKAFKQSATLKSHTFVHSDGAKPFVCDVCGKRFARKGSLQVHARSHSGVRVFACGLCSKTFTTNGKLTIHMRNHTGSRPYRCEKCERTFNQSSALKQHLWTHSGFRPLQCPLCCKGFIRKVRLNDHLKQCGK